MEKQIFNLPRVINASGKMTILGGSRVSPNVGEALVEGASSFYVIKELKNAAEEYLAYCLNVPRTYLCTSASSGIAQCVCASIARSHYAYILNPYHVEKNEIIIPKGHMVNYGTPISLPIQMGGGKVVEAGYANECTAEHVEACISTHTAALLYVKSHHCVQKGILDIDEMRQIALKYDLPMIIDAAAEEDLSGYLKEGVSAVVYSGTKAIGGPTSGIVVGQGPFMDDLKLQEMGLGRVMKLGKENLLGLTKAIEEYKNKQVVPLEVQKQLLMPFLKKMENFSGVYTSLKQDDAGRQIIRGRIHFSDDYNVKMIASKLKEGNPVVYTRDYYVNIGIIEIDIRDVSKAELEDIYHKFEEIIEGKL